MVCYVLLQIIIIFIIIYWLFIYFFQNSEIAHWFFLKLDNNTARVSVTLFRG